jgi:hypothetical protein
MDLAASYYKAKGGTGKKYEDWMLKVGVVWNF